MTKILVIEDNEDNLELLLYLLNLHDFATITATDGESGVKIAKQEIPDLIICEIQLPKLNGYEIVKILKNDAQLKHIPIIAVTAYAMAGDRDKIRTAGFDAYIAKPINPAHFISQIEFFLPEKIRNSTQLKFRSSAKAPQEKTSSERHAVALIVDNLLANRELSKNILESIGFEVTAVQSVKDAINALQKRIPDFILSDLHFPDNSGLDFLRLVRGNKLWKSIPFIFASAMHPTEQDMKEIKNLNVKRFILLPIDSNAFIKIIKNNML